MLLLVLSELLADNIKPIVYATSNTMKWRERKKERRVFDFDPKNDRENGILNETTLYSHIQHNATNSIGVDLQATAFLRIHLWSQHNKEKILKKVIRLDR